MGAGWGAVAGGGVSPRRGGEGERKGEGAW